MEPFVFTPHGETLLGHASPCPRYTTSHQGRAACRSDHEQRHRKLRRNHPTDRASLKGMRRKAHLTLNIPCPGEAARALEPASLVRRVSEAGGTLGPPPGPGPAPALPSLPPPNVDSLPLPRLHPASPSTTP